MDSNYLKIKIDKKPKIKYILLLLIMITIIAIDFLFNIYIAKFYISIAYFFFFQFFLLLFGVDTNKFDVSDITIPPIVIVVTIILLIFLITLIILYVKKKKEIIQVKSGLNKCINCNKEFSNLSTKCPNCGFESDIEITCDNCYAINNVNRSSCVKCESKFSNDYLINQINKKITFFVVKSIVLIISSFALFNYTIAIIISLIVVCYYYKKIRKHLKIVEIHKNE